MAESQPAQQQGSTPNNYLQLWQQQPPAAPGPQMQVIQIIQFAGPVLSHVSFPRIEYGWFIPTVILYFIAVFLATIGLALGSIVGIGGALYSSAGAGGFVLGVLVAILVIPAGIVWAIVSLVLLWYYSPNRYEIAKDRLIIKAGVPCYYSLPILFDTITEVIPYNRNGCCSCVGQHYCWSFNNCIHILRKLGFHNVLIAPKNRQEFMGYLIGALTEYEKNRGIFPSIPKCLPCCR